MLTKPIRKKKRQKYGNVVLSNCRDISEKINVPERTGPVCV